MDMMGKNSELPLLIFREVVWWLIAAIVTAGILFPLWKSVAFPHLLMNALIWFVAVLYFQYTLYFSHCLALRSKWLRFLLFALNLNFFVIVIRQSQIFISIYDSFLPEDLGRLRAPLSLRQIENLFQYFFIETTLGVVACLLMIAALNARMLLSYWQSAKHRLNAGNEE